MEKENFITLAVVGSKLKQLNLTNYTCISSGLLYTVC